MLVYQVNSIPLKDVIISLAASFNTTYYHKCDEYWLKIPSNLGEGEIRGINFENGLALLTYKVTFKESVRLEFTLDEIHPVKFINSLHGPLIHEFADEGEKHSIDEFKCAIVASEQKNGHVIEFSDNVLHEVVSIEIDRKTFSEKENCELKNWNSNLQKVLSDVQGKRQFYHVGNCGVYFKDILDDALKYKDFLIARKFNLQSIAMQMFINQIVQFDDDGLKSHQQSILRIPELKKVEEIAEFIRANISADLSVKNLSRQTGLNPNKLQNGFKYLFSTSINEYITNVRLEHAKSLLKSKENNIREVVAAIGLESSSYFSKIFKNRYGISPKTYQKSVI